MQTRGSTNKSPIKLSAAENKLTRWFVFEWGKLIRQKPHWVILSSPLLRIHYYHKKQLLIKESQYLIPTYSWTLTPIPNWTYFVVQSLLIMHGSQYVTNQLHRSQYATSITNWRRLLATNFFSSSHDEDLEDAWSQNPTVHKHSNFYTRKMN